MSTHHVGLGVARIRLGRSESGQKSHSRDGEAPQARESHSGRWSDCDSDDQSAAKGEGGLLEGIGRRGGGRMRR